MLRASSRVLTYLLRMKLFEPRHRYALTSPTLVAVTCWVDPKGACK